VVCWNYLTLYGKKPKDEDPEVLRKQVLKFIEDYKVYDWTVNLEGGDYQEPESKEATT